MRALRAPSTSVDSATAATVSMSKPRATERHSMTARCASSSSSKLHSIVFPTDRWRSGTSRRLVRRDGESRSSASASRRNDIVRVCEAAISIASGTPSSATMHRTIASASPSVEDEARIEEPSPLDEQLHRRKGIEVGTGAPRWRDRQWLRGKRRLGREPERPPARRQDSHPTSRPQEGHAHLRRCIDDVLAVVEHQQTIAVGQCRNARHRRDHARTGR